MLSCFVQNLLLNIQNEITAFSREQLNGILCGLVRAQKTISFIAAASVNRSIHNIIQTAYLLSACCQKNSLGSCTGVNIAGQHILCII